MYVMLVCVRVCMCMCMYVCLPLCLSACCLPACLSACLPVCLSVCLLRHLMQDETFRNQPEPAPYPPCIPRSQEWRMHGPNWRADIPPLRHESQKRAHTRPNLTSRKVTSGRRRFIIFLEGCTKINIKCAWPNPCGMCVGRTSMPMRVRTRGRDPKDSAIGNPTPKLYHPPRHWKKNSYGSRRTQAARYAKGTGFIALRVQLTCSGAVSVLFGLHTLETSITRGPTLARTSPQVWCNSRTLRFGASEATLDGLDGDVGVSLWLDNVLI